MQLGWLHNYLYSGYSGQAEIAGFKIEELDTAIAAGSEALGDFYANRFIDRNDGTYLFDGDGQSRINRLNISTGQVQASNNAGGRLRVSSYTNGESEINGNTYNLHLGPYSTRSGTGYYAGIAINGLLNYSGGTSYDVAPHIWLGAQYRDTPGSERSDFIIGIKSGTGTSGTGTDLPQVRVRVDYDGIMTVSNRVTVSNIFSDYRYDTGGTFLYRAGSGAGTTRHINLSNSTTDPSQASVDSGITWGQRTDSQPYYMIHPRNYSNGYYSGNHLQLAWHTGVDIGAASGYGGTRFFNNSPFAGTEIGSFGKSDNYLRADYGVLAPRYYDISNTGYYFDGLDGTNLQYLNVNGNWGSNPFGSSHAQLVITGTYASIYQTSTNGNLGYMLQHIATDGAWYLYGGRGAVNGSSWDWSQRNYPTQDGSYVEFRTSARAPVFYDRDDTGYLLDPATNGTALRIFGMARIGGWTAGNYNENIRLVDAQNNYSVITFGASGEAGAGRFNILKNPSDQLELRNVSSATFWYWDQGGTAWSTTSMRAPVFYDSADSTFRLDLNSSSRLRNLYVGDSGSDWVDEGGWGSQIHISNAPHSILRVYARNEGIQTGIYSHVGGLSAVGSFTNHNLRLLRNGGTRMLLYSGYTYSEGYFEAADSLRAPLFYDSNNTGYYSDQAGTSYYNIFGANKMRADTNRQYGDNSGWWAHDPYGYGWGKPYGSFRSLEVSTSGNFSTEPAMFRIHQWGSGSCEWWKPQGTTVYLRETPGGGGSWFTRYVIERYAENTESFRAPIFYDSNNTGYFLNPDSISNLAILRVTAASSGYSAMFGPYTLSTNGVTMVLADDNRYSVQVNAPYYPHLGVSAYANSGNGTHGACLSLTGFKTAGGYRRFVMGVANQNPDELSFGWFDNADNPHYGVGINWSYPASVWYDTGHNWHARGSMRAPIFYDRDNTGYYTDPTGYSQMSSGEFNNYCRIARLDFTGVGGNSGQGTHGYSIYQEGGGWGYPYPDLRIGYHTGIKLGANAGSYEGTRVYSDYDMSDLCIQLAGSSNYSFKYKWMYTANYTGFYAGENGAHWYPNNVTYGSWRMEGNRNGWYGHRIESSYAPHLMFESGNGGIYFQDDGRWMFYHSHGNNCTGIGTSSTAGGYAIYCNGGVYATGNIVAYSDIRKKKDIVTVDNALDKVLQLRGIYYTKIYNESDTIPDGGADKRQLGVIAQEVNEVVPEVVSYTEDLDEYAVAYGNFAGLFIEAFKEQNEIVKKQSEEIKELKEILNNLILNNKG
jgi:hypothetical protein